MASQQPAPAPAANRGKRKRRPKPAPQRTCIGCRTVLPKRSLIRLVRGLDGSVTVDPTGKLEGRGAYLHDRRACWAAALDSQALDRALRMKVTEADRARLRAGSEQYRDDA